MRRQYLKCLLALVTLASPALAVAKAYDISIESSVKRQEAIERVCYAHQIGGMTKPIEEAVTRHEMFAALGNSTSQEDE